MPFDHVAVPVPYVVCRVGLPVNGPLVLHYFPLRCLVLLEVPSWLFLVGCPSWSPLMRRFTLVSCLLFRVPHSLARSPGIRCRTPLCCDGRLAHLTV
jgi:hypothetical protein